MIPSLRASLCLLLLIASTKPSSSQQQSIAHDLTVTLLGTSGPELTPDRAGIATLIQTADQTLLFDAGRNVLDSLYRAHVPPQQVTRIFLTHLHSDHIAGLPDLWMTPWFLLGRTQHLELWGPAGTQAMVDGMRAMYAHDLDHRANAIFKREDLDITVHEITPGVIYDQGVVTVTATTVEHADGDPAFAYRITSRGHTAFLTGDCTLTPALIEAGRGADLVIANVAAGSTATEAMPRWKPVFAKLLTPEQAAQLFSAIRPSLAIYSHIVKKSLPGAAGDAVILTRTRSAGYKGPLQMGQDHTSFMIHGSGKSTTVVSTKISGPLPDLDSPDARF